MCGSPHRAPSELPWHKQEFKSRALHIPVHHSYRLHHTATIHAKPFIRTSYCLPDIHAALAAGVLYPSSDINGRGRESIQAPHLGLVSHMQQKWVGMRWDKNEMLDQTSSSHQTAGLNLSSDIFFLKIHTNRKLAQQCKVFHLLAACCCWFQNAAQMIKYRTQIIKYRKLQSVLLYL